MKLSVEATDHKNKIKPECTTRNIDLYNPEVFAMIGYIIAFFLDVLFQCKIQIIAEINSM